MVIYFFLDFSFILLEKRVIFYFFIGYVEKFLLLRLGILCIWENDIGENIVYLFFLIERFIIV